jgi:predicted porin
MTKNILSLAVAAAMTAGAGIAQAQDITIYGHMHYSTDFVSTNGSVNRLTGAPKARVVRDKDDWQTGVNRNSRIGVKGSEDLGNGLKAIFQIESEVLASGNGAGGNVGDRNTYVGLSGDFGTVLMGRHDTPYKIATGSLDLFADTIADYNNHIGSWYGNNRGIGFDNRAQQTLAYISPNMNGLTIAGAVVGATIDEVAGNSDSYAISLAAMYANGPLFASLAYENYEGNLVRRNRARTVAGLVTTVNLRSNDAWKLGLGYKANDFTIGFVYENISGNGRNGMFFGPNGIPNTPVLSSGRDQQNYMVNASYAFGNNVLKAQYGHSSPDRVRNGARSYNADYDSWSIGLDHNLSKRTSLYAIYTDMQNSSAGRGNIYCANAAAGAQCARGSDQSAVSFGMQHKF